MTDPKPTRYVLQAADARMVTYDTRTGAALTSNRALAYVWTDPNAADGQRPIVADGQPSEPAGRWPLRGGSGQ